MSPAPVSFLLLVLFLGPVAARDWSLLSLMPGARHTSTTRRIDLTNYCESWRANLEVNNIRGFDAVPGECSGYIGAYLTGGQYLSDVQRAVEEATVYLSDDVAFGGDGLDAWVFDVDETLLSSVPFYQKHQYGARKVNQSSLETWMAEGNAPALERSLCLYRLIKSRGLKIFLIASRRECTRSATVDNLISAGYHGWSGLYLRHDGDNGSIGSYKAYQRQKLADEGYRLWAIVSSQWSSLFGDPSPLRIFKLPNPMYYEV